MPEPHDLEYTKELMRGLGTGVDEAAEHVMGRKMAFVVLLADFGTDLATGNYVSNIKREDVIKMLRETANRLEKRQDIPA